MNNLQPFMVGKKTLIKTFSLFVEYDGILWDGKHDFVITKTFSQRPLLVINKC